MMGTVPNSALPNSLPRPEGELEKWKERDPVKLYRERELALFIGQFASPVLLAGVGAAVGGLQPALGVLAVVSLLLAVGTLVAVPRTAPALDITEG